MIQQSEYLNIWKCEYCFGVNYKLEDVECRRCGAPKPLPRYWANTVHEHDFQFNHKDGIQIIFSSTKD